MKEKKKNKVSRNPMSSKRVQLSYTIMLLPGLIWIFMFSIVPMFGVIMAFQDFSPNRGFFRSDWVGLENFEYLMRLSEAKKSSCKYACNCRRKADFKSADSNYFCYSSE